MLPRAGGGDASALQALWLAKAANQVVYQTRQMAGALLGCKRDVGQVLIRIHPFQPMRDGGSTVVFQNCSHGFRDVSATRNLTLDQLFSNKVDERLNLNRLQQDVVGLEQD